MADNEKLLEAARMIQEHCKSVELGGKCPFVPDGVCNSEDRCEICDGVYLPENWVLPKPCRWTEGDALLAKALISVGYTSVRFLCGSYDGVFARGRDRVEVRVPRGLLCGVDTYEGVKLSDIITEYNKAR